MKLKAQPPLPRRTTASKAKRRVARPRRIGGGRQASRPTTPVRTRMSARLPAIRRVLAGTAAVAAAAGIVALLNGPWLRVGEVSWDGDAFTPSEEIGDVLESGLGTSVLAVDTDALGAHIEGLPSVASVAVSVTVDGVLSATIVEREAAFVWESAHLRYIGAADGTLVARQRLSETLDPSLAHLPRATDTRPSARVLNVGDAIPEPIVRVVTRLATIDPAVMGSSATGFEIRLDTEVGVRLVSADPGWEIGLGAYGLDPHESAADAEARLDRQLTAIRTLFATRDEADLAWVDARNPGKVYFRARG